MSDNALDFDAATMLFDNLFAQSQSQSGSFCFGGKKRLENPWHLFLADALSSIVHVEYHLLADHGRGYPERAAIGHSLNGVFAQVEQGLAQSVPISVNQHPFRAFTDDADMELLCLMAEKGKPLDPSRLKRLALELGSKAPNIVFADAAQQESGVVARHAFVQLLLEHLDARHHRLARIAVQTSPDAVWWGGALAAVLAGGVLFRLGGRIPDPLREAQSRLVPAPEAE